MRRFLPSTLALAVALSGALASCASVPPLEDDALGFVVPNIADESRRESAVFRLENVLVSTQTDPESHAFQRFWASYLLAELHSAAASAPFLTEPPPASALVYASSGATPSRTAHLVAAIDHASRARHLFPRIANRPVPAELESLTTEDVQANLDLLVATGLARLGFQTEGGTILANAPKLLDPDQCRTELARLALREDLVPWVFVLASDTLRKTDELRAYRFAVIAIESGALPAETVERLETWILTGASVQFVCPRSQTAYLPGQRKSPISGVAHRDYVAVPRR